MIESRSAGLPVLYRSQAKLLRGTPLYQSAANMEEGDSVLFSGLFVYGRAENPEWSLTERGSMEEPEFVIVLTELQPGR